MTVDKFIYDLKARLANRIQLTTDGNRLYFHSIAGAFHDDIDYAVLMKLYGGNPKPGRHALFASGVYWLRKAHHVASLAIHYVYYNFCRIHQTLRVTPAMAAGVTDRLWSVHDLIALL